VITSTWLRDLGEDARADVGQLLAECAEAGAPVQQDQYYRYAVQGGPQPCVAETPGAIYGQSLADLRAERFGDARSLRDAKRVLRAAIDACLDGRSLKSREVMRALHHRQVGS